MAVLEDVGDFVSISEIVVWEIPNFHELPQEVDTVISSPSFDFKGRNWHIQVYPNGCSRYCSSSWFGIGAFLVNSDSKHRSVRLGIVVEKYTIRYITDSCEHALYNCNRFLPASLLYSARNSLLPEGNLYVYFDTEEEIDGGDALLNRFFLCFSEEKADVFFNAYIQLSEQTEQQAVKEERKQKHDDTCKEEFKQIGKESEISLEIIDVGVIQDATDRTVWIIPNFYDLSQEYNTILRSPLFRLKDRDWYAQVYPNGCSSYDCSSGWFGIGIFSLDSDVRSRFFMKFTILGQKDGVVFTPKNVYGEPFYNCMKILPTLFLKSAKNSLFRGKDLFISLEAKADMENDEQDTFRIFLKSEVVEKCFEACVSEVRQTEEKTGSREVKHNQEDAGKQDCKQTQNESDVERLLQDFKDILLNENVSDIILKVDGQEFKAHRCILAARSPVFLAMMTHEAKEKISGIVEIVDVDSNIFSEFLHYLYTGSVENISSQNAAQLYKVADRYQVNELKNTCLNYMLVNISVENFCDVIVLLLQRAENDLKEVCIQYFLEHSLDIVSTPKWQTFLTENPIIGNELFIKHLQKIK